jgi:hypothetical protein
LASHAWRSRDWRCRGALPSEDPSDHNKGIAGDGTDFNQGAGKIWPGGTELTEEGGIIPGTKHIPPTVHPIDNTLTEASIHRDSLATGVDDNVDDDVTGYGRPDSISRRDWNEKLTAKEKQNENFRDLLHRALDAGQFICDSPCKCKSVTVTVRILPGQNVLTRHPILSRCDIY